MDYYQPAGIAHKLIFVGFMVLLLRTLDPLGPRLLAVVQPVRARARGAARQGLRVREGLRRDARRGGVARLLLLPRHQAAEAHSTLSVEAILILGIIVTMMIADMTYDGASLVLLARKFPEICGTGAASLARPRSAARSARSSRRSASSVEPAWPKIAWSPSRRPPGSLFAVAVQEALARARSSLVAHVGLLDALDARPDLPEPAAALEALPRHHGDPERLLPQTSNPPGRLLPMAESTEKLMAKIDGGRRELPEDPADGADRRRAHRALLVEGDPRLLHVHRVRPLLGQLPRAQDRQDPVARSTSRSTCATTSTRARASSSRRRCRGAPPSDEAEAHAKTRRREAIPSVPGHQPRARRHPPRRALGVHHVPRLRGAVPGPHLVRRQDRRHAPQPRHDPRRVPARAPEAVPGHGDQRQPVEPLAHGSRGVDRRARHRRPSPTSPTPRSSTGSAARRATTTARRRSRARRRSSSSRRASTSRSSGRRRAARAIPRAAPATSCSSRCSPSSNVATLNGYKEQGGMKTVVTACPHCFNTLKNEYPDFGAKLEVVHHTDFLLGLLAEKKLVPKKPGERARRLSRQLLPRSLQRRLRVAARDPEAHPGRRARRARVLDQAARPLLRRRRRADVHGGAEQEPREREAHAAARRHRREDDRERLPLLHDDAHRRPQERRASRTRSSRWTSPSCSSRAARSTRSRCRPPRRSPPKSSRPSCACAQRRVDTLSVVKYAGRSARDSLAEHHAADVVVVRARVARALAEQRDRVGRPRRPHERGLGDDAHERARLVGERDGRRARARHRRKRSSGRPRPTVLAVCVRSRSARSSAHARGGRPSRRCTARSSVTSSAAVVCECSPPPVKIVPARRVVARARGPRARALTAVDADAIDEQVCRGVVADGHREIEHVR